MTAEPPRPSPRGTRPWRRARIVALATDGASVPTIAAEVGLSSRQVYRQLASPTVRQQIREGEDERLRRIGRRAASLADAMLTVLTMVAADKTQPPASRVSAASKVIELTIHEAEAAALRDRLEALERQIGGAESRAGEVIPWRRTV